LVRARRGGGARGARGRFGERLRGLPPSAVRAVGTNTLRVAKNAAQFLREARSALGFPIDVSAVPARVIPQRALLRGAEKPPLLACGFALPSPLQKYQGCVSDVAATPTNFLP